MDWTQVIFLVVALDGLDLLSRRRLKAIETEMKAFREESNDFHECLCTLEERYLQLINKK